MVNQRATGQWKRRARGQAKQTEPLGVGWNCGYVAKTLQRDGGGNWVLLLGAGRTAIDVRRQDPAQVASIIWRGWRPRARAWHGGGIADKGLSVRCLMSRERKVVRDSRRNRVGPWTKARRRENNIQSGARRCRHAWSLPRGTARERQSFSQGGTPQKRFYT